MGPQHRRQSIVQVALWFVDVAKGTLGDDVGAELEIEQSALEVDEFRPQRLVARCEGVAGAKGRHAVEEDVDGDLEAALGAEEEVLGGEEGERLDEMDGGDEEEEGEREPDARGGRLDGEVVGGGAEGAIPRDGFGEEDGAEEDEEREDAETWLALGRVWCFVIHDQLRSESFIRCGLGGGENVRVPRDYHGGQCGLGVSETHVVEERWQRPWRGTKRLYMFRHVCVYIPVENHG